MGDSEGGWSVWSDGLEGKVGVPRGWESRAALCLGEEELDLRPEGEGVHSGIEL